MAFSFTDAFNILVIAGLLCYIFTMILYKYILKNHAVPFIASSIILMFVFLFQFLMRFAERLVGKGLDTWVVIQLIIYNLAWMVVLVVPMATLVSTLMAFGAMSQNNEITILKASGVSLYKMLISPIIGGILIGYLLILFNNHVLPDANHSAKILMFDISQTKPTLSLEPGIFSQEVSNYAILAREVNRNSNVLNNITIYDYTNPTKVNVVTAQRGKVYFSFDQTKLIMDLTEGEIHESDMNEQHLYRKIVFNEHRISMEASQFSFQQTTPGGQRGDRELSAQVMNIIVDSLKQIQKRYHQDLVRISHYFFLNDSISKPVADVDQVVGSDLVFIRAQERIRDASSNILNANNRIQAIHREINKYEVEIHKKYAIPAACLIFVLLGAPLGIVARRGGFGVAASISLLFFLFYWAFLIGGEKLADRAIVTPFWGMWAGNFFMATIGIILIIKSAKETVLIDYSSFTRFLPGRWKQNKVSE